MQVRSPPGAARPSIKPNRGPVHGAPIPSFRYVAPEPDTCRSAKIRHARLRCGDSSWMWPSHPTGFTYFLDRRPIDGPACVRRCQAPAVRSGPTRVPRRSARKRQNASAMEPWQRHASDSDLHGFEFCPGVRQGTRSDVNGRCDVYLPQKHASRSPRWLAARGQPGRRSTSSPRRALRLRASADARSQFAPHR